MKRSLKREFNINIVLANIFITTLLGISLGYLLYQNEINNVKTILRLENEAIANSIDGYFKKFRIVIDFLSDLEKVRKGYKLSSREIEELARLYHLFEKHDPNINYLYSGYFTNTLIIYNYTPPPGYIAMIRPWYLAAIESAPNISKGLTYTEAKTGEWLISLSKALYENGKIVGVIAVDTHIDKINQLLNTQKSQYNSLYSYIVNDYEEIIFHPNTNLLFKKLKDLISPIPNLNKTKGEFEYTFDSTQKLAYYTKLNDLKWTIITAVNKSEVINNVLRRIIPPLFFALLLSIILGIIVDRITINKVIVPVEHLKQRIENILNQTSEKDEYEYPDNEIGSIAKNIEGITEKELYKKNVELSNLNKKLEELSIKDALTGLYNRRKMDKELEKHIYIWERYKRPFSIIIIDIDDFKKINDTYGHLTGDIILEELSKIIKENIRKSDIVSRWGGEEFLILLPETNIQNAALVAEALRIKIEEANFGIDEKITISAGVVSIENNESIDSLIQRADKNLYKAKESGKNKVVF